MMMREDRAKQFMPFDAMKGLQEALRDREEKHSRVEKHEISEDQQRENELVMLKIIPGTDVKLTFFHAFHELTLTGRVNEISRAYRYIKIGESRIFFDDIYTIELTGGSDARI